MRLSEVLGGNLKLLDYLNGALISAEFIKGFVPISGVSYLVAGLHLLIWLL